MRSKIKFILVICFISFIFFPLIAIAHDTIIFEDDFSGENLEQWSFIHTNVANWTIEDGKLKGECFQWIPWNWKENSLAIANVDLIAGTFEAHIYNEWGERHGLIFGLNMIDENNMSFYFFGHDIQGYHGIILEYVTITNDAHDSSKSYVLFYSDTWPEKFTGQTNHWKVSIHNQCIDCYLNGELVTSQCDPYYKGGKVGFRIWESKNYFDNVIVRSQPSAFEQSFKESLLNETLLVKKAIANNVRLTGDFDGTLDFQEFEIVNITTGPFAGKGFSKGKWETTLEGVSYKGKWHGVAFKKEDKIYLKGSISGDISGIVEGYLIESIPGSGIYDQYQATWKLGRFGSTTTSATINLNGTLVYQSDSEYPDTEFYVLQTNMEGNVYGDYSSHLNITLTHIRIKDELSPYRGQGFSIISYLCDSGSGEGWTYDKLVYPGITELRGIFSDPLLGIVRATLDETETPRSLFVTVERIDLGLPPMADLKVKVWGPRRVSPGQTIDYIIEYRNDGLKVAEDVFVVDNLPLEVEYVSSTKKGTYKRTTHEVIWELGSLPPKSRNYLTATVRVQWGLPWGTQLRNIVSIPKEKIKIEIDPTVNISYEIIETTQEFVKMNACISRESQIVSIISMEGNYTHVTEEIDPVFDYIEGVDEIELHSKFTVPYHSAILSDVRVKASKEAIELLKNSKEFKDLNKEIIEWQDFLDWLYDKDYISYPLYEDYTRVNKNRRLAFFIPVVAEKVPVFGKWLSEASKAVIEGVPIQWRHKLDSDIRIESCVKYGICSLYQAMEEYLKEISQDADSQGQIIDVAHDPNIKYGPQGSVLPGQKLTYRIEYENEGEGIAFGVYFTDTLDEDLDDSTLEIGPVFNKNGVKIAEPGIYDPNTRTITWFVGEVGPGEGGYAEFSVNVRDDAPDGTEIINFATVYFPSVPEETRTNGIVSVVRLYPPPVAEANGPYEGEVGSPITLDASGSYDVDGAIVSYEWDFNDDGIYDETTASPTITHTWTEPYSGIVRLRVTDNDNQTATDTTFVEIKAVSIRGDLDNDGDVDQNDLNILLTYRNQPASACPECDIDGDGVITVLDARKLVLLCTRPRCATE